MLGRSLWTLSLLTAALAVSSAAGKSPFRAISCRPVPRWRAGLERSWMVAVPIQGDERVTLVSMNNDLVFASTNKANFHTYDAETGRLLWSANLGSQNARATPASVNSFGVYVTNLNMLYALDRRLGGRSGNTTCISCRRVPRPATMNMSTSG